jgi:hypothetical protein
MTKKNLFYNFFLLLGYLFNILLLGLFIVSGYLAFRLDFDFIYLLTSIFIHIYFLKISKNTPFSHYIPIFMCFSNFVYFISLCFFGTITLLS